MHCDSGCAGTTSKAIGFLRKQKEVKQVEQRVEQAQQQAQQERQQKELAERRVEELAQRLRELGLEP